MAIPLYLAMTAAELVGKVDLPENIGWMACHFSHYSTGLTNLPRHLPKGSLLILNDRTPVHGHDPVQIAGILEETVQRLMCSGLLLDFQRPNCSESQKIAAALVQLPFPVAVSDPYAQALDCPVFVSAPPLHKSLSDHLAPWQGREIWLEAALGGELAVITEAGTDFTPLPPGEAPECPHVDEKLHCRYCISPYPEQAHIILRRTREDLNGLLKEAESFGIKQAVGLYQELGR